MLLSTPDRGVIFGTHSTGTIRPESRSWRVFDHSTQPPLLFTAPLRVLALLELPLPSPKGQRPGSYRCRVTLIDHPHHSRLRLY